MYFYTDGFTPLWWKSFILHSHLLSSFIINVTLWFHFDNSSFIFCTLFSLCFLVFYIFIVLPLASLEDSSSLSSYFFFFTFCTMNFLSFVIIFALFVFALCFVLSFIVIIALFNFASCFIFCILVLFFIFMLCILLLYIIVYPIGCYLDGLFYFMYLNFTFLLIVSGQFNFWFLTCASCFSPKFIIIIVHIVKLSLFIQMHNFCFCLMGNSFFEMPFNLHSFCFVLFFGAFITIPSLIPFITSQLSFETRYFFMFSCFVSMDKTYEIMLSMMGFMFLFQIIDHVFNAPIHFLFMDLNFYYTNPNVVEATIGFKWHITSQCVYFASRTIVLFRVLLPKKKFS